MGAGWYRWQAYINDDAGSRWTISEGEVQVLPNLQAATGGFDDREDDEIMLDCVVASLINNVLTDAQEYRIHERELRKFTSMRCNRKGHRVLLSKTGNCGKPRLLFPLPPHIAQAPKRKSMDGGRIAIEVSAWRLESRALPPDWGPRRLPVPAAFSGSNPESWMQAESMSALAC
jgi:hypothetical protein